LKSSSCRIRVTRPCWLSPRCYGELPPLLHLATHLRGTDGPSPRRGGLSRCPNLGCPTSGTGRTAGPFSWNLKLHQNQRPRPYQPPPKRISRTMMMITTVVVSMLPPYPRREYGSFRTSTQRGSQLIGVFDRAR